MIISIASACCIGKSAAIVGNMQSGMKSTFPMNASVNTIFMIGQKYRSGDFD